MANETAPTREAGEATTPSGPATACAAAIASRFGEHDGGSRDLPSIDFVQRLLARRTVRRYAARQLSDALIDLLVAGGLSASSKSDFQQASILRLRDPGKRAALGALFPAMPWIAVAPVFLVFLGDARRLERIGALRGKPVDNGTLEGFFNASVDAALTLQTVILAAESAGLGCCPISVIRNRIDEVAALVELPDKVFPVAGLCLGYPEGEGHVSLRLPRRLTVHEDVYDESGFDRLVDSYDRERDARHSIPRASQREPERFGYAAFYGWSEDKARQAVSPEGAAFPRYLRAHGFTLD
jgi:FMN reductase [NAD(P)H]